MGSGASEPFGYPVTKRFKERLADELVNKFRKDIQSLSSEEKILLTVLQHQGYKDIEDVFEFQKQISKASKLFPFVVEFLRSIPLGGTIQGIPTSAYGQGVEAKNYFDYNET